MFRKNITLASAKKIVDTINALISAGDPATAESMRAWFNSQFRDFRIERMMDGSRVVGYEVKSDLYGVDSLRETEVRTPGSRKQKPEAMQSEITSAATMPRSRAQRRQDMIDSIAAMQDELPLFDLEDISAAVG